MVLSFGHLGADGDILHKFHTKTIPKKDERVIRFEKLTDDLDQ